MRICPHLYSLIAALALVAMAIGCTVRPSYVLDRDRMKAVTRDMLLADAYLMDLRVEDSVASYYYESVLARHSVSRAVYDSSLVWYGEHSPVYVSIIEELQKEFEVAEAWTDSLYNDSVQVNRLRYVAPISDWTSPSRVQIVPSMRYYLAQMDVATGSYSGGDTLYLRLRTVPVLQHGEELRGRVLLLDSALLPYWSHAEMLSEVDAVTRQMDIVLPDSMPAHGTLRLQLMFMRREAARRSIPLYLDSIALFEYVPPYKV